MRWKNSRAAPSRTARARRSLTYERTKGSGEKRTLPAEFGYDYMKAAFEHAGDRNAQWFLGAAPDPIDRLREALDFAKPGPLATTPRTPSETGVAEFLATLSGGMPVEPGSALQGLDQIRAALVAELVSDFVAGRFDDEAADLVRDHFGRP